VSIRVLLADDQAMVRAGFRMILESDREIEVVGEAANGEQATAGTRRLRPDIVLMDIQMPDGDGLQARAPRPSSGRRPGVRERAGHARRVDAPLSFDRGASGKDLP
jgi:AmiR/NasT family two-component response regulator